MFKELFSISTCVYLNSTTVKPLIIRFLNITYDIALIKVVQ